jgi:ABC transport system ATP-binding/permease protein
VLEVVKDIAEVLPLGKGHITAGQLLERFLFDYGQQHQYVSTLSGGERRRLYLLTILMKNPNFLILDEPTNDLDIMTLQVLEDFLLDYKGCLIIVSHDRYFLDKLTDHLFVFEGEGNVRDFNGNYREYREWAKEQERQQRQEEKRTLTAPVQPQEEHPKKKKSYKEQREMEHLEQDMATLELEKQELSDKLVSGITDHAELTAIAHRIEQIIGLLDEKELRWLELSEMA